MPPAPVTPSTPGQSVAPSSGEVMQVVAASRKTAWMSCIQAEVLSKAALVLTRSARWLSPPRVSLSWSLARLGESGTRMDGLQREQSEESQEMVVDFLVDTNPVPSTWTDSDGWGVLQPSSKSPEPHSDHL